MVKESCGETGFVISNPESSEPWLSTQWGTRVVITDFETLNDGLLGITVEAKEMVELSDFYRENDGLLKAHCVPSEHWPPQSPSAVSKALAEQLKYVFAQHQELAQLYPYTHLEDARWVCGRWLELLPLDLTSKQQFIKSESFQSAQKYIKTIVLGGEREN
jgi:hypothetical protein